MSNEKPLIRDIIARDLSRKIETVVKVYDRSQLAEDLRQFVITDSLARELAKFLDNFTENLRSRIHGGSGGDGMAVWLWGFFGSGKSHVAKVMGYVLENDIVDPDNQRRAIDIFMLHLDDPTLIKARELKSALAEVRNNASCKTIAFEIKSKLDQANPESVTEICLRSFYESLGFASTIWLARLERKLKVEGHYEKFCSAYREQTGRDWLQDRREHGFYIEEITNALAVSLEKSTQAARDVLENYQRDHARVTPEGFAQELCEYLKAQAKEVRPREPHIIFVIDEMGQFIGDREDRIHELQSIVEQSGVQGRGRIWFICTSQEALDQVVDRTGLRLNALGKLDARFSTKIPLTGEDVRRVVQDRLLRKNEVTTPAVKTLYSRSEGAIEDLCSLHIERKLATIDQNSFVSSYPFLPPIIPLVQDVFNAMRGFKLSGSERSMIALAQGALQALADQPLGVLVPLNLIFDQVTDELSSNDYLGTSGMRLIREADTRIPNTPVPSGQILKALWLVQRVDWIPRTPEVLSKLLANNLDVDIVKLRAGIEQTLDRLQAVGLVGKNEATGQYRYLSEKERGIEEDIVAFIQDLGAGIGVAKRRVAELIKTRLLRKSKWGDFKIEFGKSGIIDFSLTFDDEMITNVGEITVKLLSPLSNPDTEAIEQENLAFGTKGRKITWVAAEDKTLIEKLKRLEALYKVPEKPKWKNDVSPETEKVLKEKEKDRADLEKSVAGILETCLKKGHIYYSGEGANLDGTKDFEAIAEEIVGVVATHLYTRFSIADKKFDEENIPSYVKSTTKSLDRLDPDLALFDIQGNLLRNSPLVQTIFEEVSRRKDESLDTDGRALLEYFEKIPFGWPDALLRLVLAAMFRGGAIYLEPPDSDQPVYDISTPAIETFFTGPQKFKKTRFYPMIGALSPAEVKVAKDALIALGEVSVPDSAHGLAERIRGVGTHLIKDAEKVQQRVSDLRLPLPKTYLKAKPVTEPATALRDPFACVRKFIDDRAAWKEVADFIQSYDQFVENKRDTFFIEYAAVLGYARACSSAFDDAEGVKAKKALDEFDAVVAAQEILAKWKAVQESALVVLDRYRTVYREALQACAGEIAKLRQEIESSAEYSRLDTSRRSKVLNGSFGPGSSLAIDATITLTTANDLLKASQQHKISELEALRMAVPGHRKAIFNRCESEWQKQQAATPPKPGAPPIPSKPVGKVFRLNIHARLSGKRFVNQTEFNSFWAKLAEEITAKIDEGFEIVLED